MKLLAGEDVRRRLYIPALIAVVTFFYLVTLAPTVLWGDDAAYQRLAWESRMGRVGVEHWLWLQAARLFTYFPVKDVAYRVNLLSALAGGLTIFLLFQASLSLLKDRFAAVVAVLSLAVSHTFWTSAVRAEVYTIFTAFMALLLYLWFSWEADQPHRIFIATTLFGTALLSHQMTILLLPAFVLLLWQRRHWLNVRQWLLLLVAFVIGLVPFLTLIQQNAGERSLFDSLLSHFTRGGQYSEALFDFSAAAFVRDASLWIGFLGLQFVGLAGLSGILGMVEVVRRRLFQPWLVPLTLYATTVLFAFSYRVNDQFVFYQPSYIVFAFFVGKGWKVLEEKWPRMGKPSPRLVCLLLVTLVPILTYSLTPALLDAAQKNPMAIRTLPGREPNRFFIWPAKNGYTGAADYGRAALQSLPQNAVLIGDHTPIQTIWYLQRVEGVRPDVQLIGVGAGQDLAPVIARLPEGAVIFLADNNPVYYNLRSVPGFQLEPTGPVYQLLVDQQSNGNAQE